MAKAERLEDLGKLSILLGQITDEPIFDIVTGRKKDFPDYFDTLDLEQKEELLLKIAYGLEDLKNKLCEAWNIAQGNEDEY